MELQNMLYMKSVLLFAHENLFTQFIDFYKNIVCSCETHVAFMVI